MVVSEPAYLEQAIVAEETKEQQEGREETQDAQVRHALRLAKDAEVDQADSLPASECSSSGHSSLHSPTNSSDDEEAQQQPLKCSAVHTLERDMPDYDYSEQVQELRRRILIDIEENPGFYSSIDIEKCRQDDWHIARFLLRNKMVLDDAFDMLRKAMRFTNESLTNELRAEDFPAEFYQLGGIFGYEPDRKGNKMLYLRIAYHRKTPEILSVIQAFIFRNIKQLDDEAKGRGISIVFVCSGAGLASADMDLLLFVVSTLKNYFPKGLSYFLVHELPWILKPFWHIAKAWIPEEHRQLIKFSDSRTIYEYVDKENLPDFLGGTCKREYRSAPKDCTTLEQASKLWGIDLITIRKVFEKFEENLPEETVTRIRRFLDEQEARNDE